MKDILLKELKREVSEGSLTQRDAVYVVELFDEEMEEGYSDGEALYLALEEIKLLKEENFVDSKKLSKEEESQMRGEHHQKYQ